MSLAASPIGFKSIFLSKNNVSQICVTLLLGIYSSYPPDPVYPVLEIIISLHPPKEAILKE